MIPARNSASRSHEVNNGRRREAFSRYLEQRERGSPRNYNTSSKGAKPGASSPSAWALSPGRVSTMKTSSSSSAPSTSMCHTPPESPVSKAKMRSGGGGAVAGVLKLIQLRFINARAEATMANLKVNVEDQLFWVWLRIYKMRKYVVENLIEVQRLRQEIKLRQVLSLQMPLLNEWSKLEAKNCEALSKLTRKLQALSARSPLLHGATVDVVSIHEEMVRAIEVMDEIEDFVIKFLPRQVEIILYEMTELLNMSKQELLYFEELVKSIFLVPVFAANESSLKVHFLQKIEEQRRHLQQIDNSGFSEVPSSIPPSPKIPNFFSRFRFSLASDCHGFKLSGSRKVQASSVEVAFQPNFSSLAIKSFGVPKEDDDKQSSDVNPSSSATTVSSAAILPVVSSPPARKDVEEIHTCVTRIEQDYIEPWDQNSYYPTVLPLRKPNSGDPELLDQEEFGNVAKHLHYDENSINSAEELGLTSGPHCKKQMLFFKVPDSLPVTKQPTAKRSVSERSSPFEGLPEGFMGKMLVYKSGTVKLKLGDVLYDVSPGPNTVFHNDVAAINGKERNCCRIGSSAKFATVTPDVESLLNSEPDMQINK
ncbi:hypothetical protein IGI04_001480 [Brassica rapa subsp. trilocularis]|uniref:DNA-directed RNA polymerase III subunit RPC4 n=1 Tax=Brassica rapa subsp. trilocularis TaxID=1813537 RepID=A0ABQ7NSR3_BRACM|nr:hypothetical protein IGI04_001480 [Brassica rapa subsp. trilocularis]